MGNLAPTRASYSSSFISLGIVISMLFGMMVVVVVLIFMVMMMTHLARPKSAIFTMWLSPTNTFRAARSLRCFTMS